MATAVVARFHPDANKRFDCRYAQKFPGNAQDVGVVMAPAEFRGNLVEAHRRAHPVEFIGGYAHADSGSANENAPIGFTFRNKFGDGGGDVGIVDALVCFVGGESVDGIGGFVFVQRLSVLNWANAHTVAGIGDVKRADNPIDVGRLSVVFQISVMIAQKHVSHKTVRDFSSAMVATDGDSHRYIPALLRLRRAAPFGRERSRQSLPGVKTEEL